MTHRTVVSALWAAIFFTTITVITTALLAQ